MTTTCTCGRAASFATPVSGRSGADQHPVVWRGCPVCPGRAVGRPVPAYVISTGGASAAEKWDAARAAGEARGEAAAQDRAVAEALDALLSQAAVLGRRGTRPPTRKWGAAQLVYGPTETGPVVYRLSNGWVGTRAALEEALRAPL